MKWHRAWRAANPDSDARTVILLETNNFVL